MVSQFLRFMDGDETPDVGEPFTQPPVVCAKDDDGRWMPGSLENHPQSPTVPVEEDVRPMAATVIID
jgi:hypothetical protein